MEDRQKRGKKKKSRFRRKCILVLFIKGRGICYVCKLTNLRRQRVMDTIVIYAPVEGTEIAMDFRSLERSQFRC